MRKDEEGEYLQGEIPVFIQSYLFLIKEFQLDKQFSRKTKGKYRKFENKTRYDFRYVLNM